MPSFAPPWRLAVRALTGALLALATLPAASSAAVQTFGSDLTAPANLPEARQADTAYWQASFADGRSPSAPASGQIRSFKVKGIALAKPVAGVIGGETMFHLQALHKNAGGTFTILRTSQAFFLPDRDADPQTVTTYAPENFCVDTGDLLVFNTVGGWDGIVDMSGPYPLGTPLQIFSRIPSASVSEFMGADKTNNGATITATNGAGRELLMQMSLGTGPDATPLCPGGTEGQPAPGGPGATPTTPTPKPVVIQKATIPPKQRVTVSSKGKLAVSVFCLPGTGRCSGIVRVMSKGAKPTSLGSGTFNLGAKKGGHATVRLNALGRRRFSAAKGKLGVKLVAVTRPGGSTRTSSLAVTIRRRGA